VLASDVDEVPYSTRDVAGSLVVQRITADVDDGLAATDEITGAVLSATTAGLMTTVPVPYFAVLAVLVARTVTAC
jgi:hypothetical protein